MSTSYSIDGPGVSLEQEIKDFIASFPAVPPNQPRDDAGLSKHRDTVLAYLNSSIVTSAFLFQYCDLNSQYSTSVEPFRALGMTGEDVMENMYLHGIPQLKDVVSDDKSDSDSLADYVVRVLGHASYMKLEADAVQADMANIWSPMWERNRKWRTKVDRERVRCTRCHVRGDQFGYNRSMLCRGCGSNGWTIFITEKIGYKDGNATAADVVSPGSQ